MPIVQLVSSPPPLPPVTPSFFVVDVAALDQFIDAGHQIFIVIAGIVVLDDVAEILAVAGAAARIRIEHDIAFRRHPLKFVIEDITVGRVRPAVDVQNQRIFFCRIEIGRLLHPGLNLLAVKARVPDLFGFRKIKLRK